MIWFLLALAAALFGLYNVFIKLAADHVEAVLGAVILQFVAALFGLGLLMWMRFAEGGAMQASPRGIVLAVLAGVAIGMVEVLTFVVYGRGISVAVGNPLIVGGSLLVTTGIGVALLREALTPLQILAIVLVAAGLGLLAWEAARA